MIVCNNCKKDTPDSSKSCFHCHEPIRGYEEKNAGTMPYMDKFKKCICGHENATTEDLCEICCAELNVIYGRCKKCRKEVSVDIELCEDCAVPEQYECEKSSEKKIFESPVPLQPKIVCQSNPLFNPEIKSGYVIGREGDINTTCLNNDAISRKHASFIEEGGTWFIRDEGSTYGTKVEWESITPHEKVFLSNGNVIVLADEIVFVFEMV